MHPSIVAFVLVSEIAQQHECTALQAGASADVGVAVAAAAVSLHGRRANAAVAAVAAAHAQTTQAPAIEGQAAMYLDTQR